MLKANIPPNADFVPVENADDNVVVALAMTKKDATILRDGANNGTAALDKANVSEYYIACLQQRVGILEDMLRTRNVVNNTIQDDLNGNDAALLQQALDENKSLKEEVKSLKEEMEKIKQVQVGQAHQLATQCCMVVEVQQAQTVQAEQIATNFAWTATKADAQTCNEKYQYLLDGNTVECDDGRKWKADVVMYRVRDEASKTFEKCKRLEDLIRILKVKLDKCMASNAMQDAGSDGEEMQNADISSPSDSGALSCL